MAAPLTDEQRRDFLQAHVDADLIFILDEAGVPLNVQYDLCQNYRSVRKFSALGDTRVEVRAAFQADLGLDPAANPAARPILASLVTAWQVSSEVTDKEIQARAEAKNLGVPRQVTFTDRNALVSSYERVYGRLEDKDTPSADYLSQKVEEVEQGELLASQLDEIGSKEETLTIAIQSSVDSAGRLRATRERKKSKLPKDSEELRAKLKLEANSFVMLGAKFRNRAWFQGLVPNDYVKYVDWLLGEKVYQLQVPKASSEGMRPLSPPWTILLRYEQQVRKEAYKQAVRQNRSIHDTLPEAMANSELKEVNFLSPVALSFLGGDESSSRPSVPGAEDAADPPVKYLKKGKGKGKGKGRFDKRFGFLNSQTPDGRQICYAYQEGKCKENCGRVHVCQICMNPHPLKDCKFKIKQKEVPNKDTSKN